MEKSSGKIHNEVVFLPEVKHYEQTKDKCLAWETYTQWIYFSRDCCWPLLYYAANENDFLQLNVWWLHPKADFPFCHVLWLASLFIPQDTLFPFLLDKSNSASAICVRQLFRYWFNVTATAHPCSRSLHHVLLRRGADRLKLYWHSLTEQPGSDAEIFPSD